MNIYLKNILKYKHFPLIILLLISFFSNIYYFNTNKAVWWDEAEYLNFVNYVTKGVPYNTWEGRAMLYPLILSLFGLINSNEYFLRFGLLIINCLTILATYITIKELTNKKISFFSTLLFQTSFLFLFFQIRFLTTIPSIMFIMFGLYFFLKKGIKNRIISGVFIGLSISTRFTSLFIIPSMLLYDLYSKKDRVKLKNYIWILTILIGLLPIILFDLFNGNLPFNSMITFFLASANHSSIQPWNFYITSYYIYGLLSVPFFLIGLIKYFKLDKKKVLIIGFFILYFFMHSFISKHKEDRYILPIVPFYFLITVQGMNMIINLFKKKINKNIRFGIMIIICSILIFQQVTLVNNSIIYKSESYKWVKDATLFLKNYLKPNEIIMGNTPQINYYSERKMINFPENETELYSILNNNKNINIIVLSLTEGIPNYSNTFNSDNFTIINVGRLNDKILTYTIKYNRNKIN